MLLDLPPELLDVIFRTLDDRSQRNLVATCNSFRSHWLPEAWRTLTFTGPKVKSQLNRFVAWINETPSKTVPLISNVQFLFIRACLLEDIAPSELEGEQNTDIQDSDIANLLSHLVDSLKVLLIDLPPTPDSQLFDITLTCIACLHKLERLFLGRVKVDDGHEVVCEYRNLKEATMIWCHGIVEQRLLADQLELEYLDVHDSWDIGNLSAVSHQWQNLKSFRFSAIDFAYALRILENGRGAMTSLEDVSIEVPMSEGVFFEIISQLSNYPVRRLHLCLSAEGLGVFLTTPAGRNDLPSGFSPKWLAYISRSLKHLEELVLDYRSGGTFLELVWPGDQSTYAIALSPAQNLHTLAISIHALPQNGWDDCREIAQVYFEHIPSLQALHFPAMPIFPYDLVRLSRGPPLATVPETCYKGYTALGRPGQPDHIESLGDTYRPFWITRGPDVAVDRHRREGGLRIVANNSDGESSEFSEAVFDDLVPDIDFFDQDDVDLGIWFGDPDEDEDWSSTSEGEQEQGEQPDPPPFTSEEWMEGLTIGVSNMNLRVGQLDFSELDRHSSSSNDVLDDDDSDFSADLPPPLD